MDGKTMDAKKVNGLKMFLMATIKMIASGEHESTNTIEAKISDGVASYLSKKYKDYYESLRFDYDNCESIDAYYMNKCIGCADGREGDYNCAKNDGLVLIINLAINDVFH